MNTHESLPALRRANPRTDPGFDRAVEAVRARIDAASHVPAAASRPTRRRAARLSLAGVALAAAALATAVLLGLDSPGGGPGVVENAAAAVHRAATRTAASAERSGTATVRITHGGKLWAAKRVGWNGDDLSLTDTSPGRDGRAGSEMRVVDGTMYAQDPAGNGWLSMGSPDSIDPGSGTTPAEYLAAVRADDDGATLRRVTDGMTGLTTRRLADGSTVYAGTVRAGLIARETGFKGGQPIRVLPFGYVAHDEAADAGNLLDTSVTIGPEGVIRELAVAWPGWTYTVTYSDLGSTPAPTAPTDVRKPGRS